jgi:hypothetical protein
MSHILTQNELIEAGDHPNANATKLTLGTLGISNGCIDSKINARGYPQMAYNNTFGVQLYNETVFDAVTANLTTCYELIDQCRAVATESDPTAQGLNQTVNGACLLAVEMCFVNIQGALSAVSEVRRGPQIQTGLF